MACCIRAPPVITRAVASPRDEHRDAMPPDHTILASSIHQPRQRHKPYHASWSPVHVSSVAWRLPVARPQCSATQHNTMQYNKHKTTLRERVARCVPRASPIDDAHGSWYCTERLPHGISREPAPRTVPHPTSLINSRSTKVRHGFL